MATVETVPTKKYSEEELLALPDLGFKIEYVDGGLLTMTPAGSEHDAIGVQVTSLIYAHARKRGLITNGQAGFWMSNGNVRVPDVSFTRRQRFPASKPPQGFVQGAPDLAIEIISPTDEMADLLKKVGEYFESGCQLVWVINPRRRTVIVYQSISDTATLGLDDEITGGDLLPKFHARVADFFDTGWAQMGGDED